MPENSRKAQFPVSLPQIGNLPPRRKFLTEPARLPEEGSKAHSPVSLPILIKFLILRNFSILIKIWTLRKYPILVNFRPTERQTESKYKERRR